MGYYTRHSLTVHGATAEQQEMHEKAIAEMTGYTPEHLWEDESKWYESSTDMKKYSLLHPGVLFEIKCEGEESGDYHRDYYKDGKELICKGEIVYEPFDETKMK